MVRMRRRPTTPGEILREEYLRPLGITQRVLAEHIGCDLKVINRIVNGRTGVTVPFAMRLAATLGTTPDFWLNAQKAVDIYEASRTVEKLPHPLVIAGHLVRA